MSEIRFITLNPGHFHAALVQKEMYPQVARQTHVYGPLGPDLVLHLQRMAGFNTRRQNPTNWELEVHAGPDYLDRLRRERPGNVVVIAGRNATKIDAIRAAIDAGLHVLADKPWVLRPDDLPKLDAALAQAEERQLVAYDVMTERHEITSILQRELLQDEAIFGTIQAGSPEEPGVFMESVHYLKKLVAGVPLRRPSWFFDVAQQGEGLSDVGTHLVDLVMWLLYPEQPIDAAGDVCILSARRWPTVLTPADFHAITGEADFPDDILEDVQSGQLTYYCNTQVGYTVRGVHVKLNVLWDLEAEAGGGDTHRAVFRGGHARVEVRQGPEEHYQPELYVVPNRAIDLPRVRAALDNRVQRLQARYPGVGVIDLDTHFRVAVPSSYRVGHEAHFAEVTGQFLRYVQGPDRLPAWERPNMLAKYTVTTRGVDLSKRPSRQGATP